MSKIELIEIKQSMLMNNDLEAERLRNRLVQHSVVMLNLMASPGSGKTSLLIQTIRRLRKMANLRMGVIEGDIDSIVDAEKISKEDVAAVQIRTGGACHLDASMVRYGIDALDLDNLDLIFIENVGNLVCPAEFDIGENLKAVILSVPEGDDKPLKYPMMFSVCDVLVVNKIDWLPDEGFNLNTLEKHVRKLNPNIKIFPVSCRSGEGLDDWCNWLLGKCSEILGKKL